MTPEEEKELTEHLEALAKILCKDSGQGDRQGGGLTKGKNWVN